eukprot:SAG31_NODE_29263_length_398_cov_0.785953_1_plen_124_part_10
MARQLLSKCQSFADKHTQMIYRWICWMEAQLRLESAEDRQTSALKRQRTKWIEKRWPHVKKVLSMLIEYEAEAPSGSSGAGSGISGSGISGGGGSGRSSETIELSDSDGESSAAGAVQSGAMRG